MAGKAEELRPVMVRLPEKLRRELLRAAAASGRSMNHEVIYRLQASFRGGDALTAAELKREMHHFRGWLTHLMGSQTLPVSGQPAQSGEEEGKL